MIHSAKFYFSVNTSIKRLIRKINRTQKAFQTEAKWSKLFQRGFIRWRSYQFLHDYENGDL